ncbi:MAG: anti-anti-sigma factor [Paenibacillus sp.]|jgi:stage II sporulation protein AA (anti-sigma F factor antagonist)|nr:anti-anti-sigma factor [Paenibacillus sp.]
MNGELVIEERAIAGGVILDMKGDLTKDAEGILLHQRKWAEEYSEEARVILNFSKVEYINSAGIAVLIRLAQTVKKASITLYAFGINTHYQKMFRLIGLTEFIMIYPDEYSLMQRLR